MSQIMTQYVSIWIKYSELYIHNEVTNRFDKNYVGMTVVPGCGSVDCTLKLRDDSRLLGIVPRQSLGWMNQMDPCQGCMAYAIACPSMIVILPRKCKKHYDYLHYALTLILYAQLLSIRA